MKSCSINRRPPAYFDELEEEFNASHDDIHLTIESPNDAATILKTRFIREDYPDIIGIGGDINYLLLCRRGDSGGSVLL